MIIDLKNEPYLIMGTTSNYKSDIAKDGILIEIDGTDKHLSLQDTRNEYFFKLNSETFENLALTGNLNKNISFKSGIINSNLSVQASITPVSVIWQHSMYILSDSVAQSLKAQKYTGIRYLEILNPKSKRIYSAMIGRELLPNNFSQLVKFDLRVTPYDYSYDIDQIDNLSMDFYIIGNENIIPFSMPPTIISNKVYHILHNQSDLVFYPLNTESRRLDLLDPKDIKLIP